MNDAAVVAALMAAYAIFLLKQQEAGAGKSARKFEGHGQADDSAAHDDDVVAGINHGLRWRVYAFWNGPFFGIFASSQNWFTTRVVAEA
jgi:hypothetical protein